jgi:hypothetical protein
MVNIDWQLPNNIPPVRAQLDSNFQAIKKPAFLLVFSPVVSKG